MKLVLMRHTEAESGSEDFSRTLTSKGRQDAEKSAHFFCGTNWTVQKILSSPLTRTQETRKIFTKVLLVKKYHLSPSFQEGVEKSLKPGFSWEKMGDLLDVEANSCVVLIFHAPDIAHLASHFTSMPVSNYYFSPGSMIALNLTQDTIQGRAIQIWQSQPDFLPD